MTNQSKGKHFLMCMDLPISSLTENYFEVISSNVCYFSNIEIFPQNRIYLSLNVTYNQSFDIAFMCFKTTHSVLCMKVTFVFFNSSFRFL